MTRPPRLALTLAIIAAVLTAACAHASDFWKSYYLLPMGPGQFPDSGRQDPELRIATFDREFRSDWAKHDGAVKPYLRTYDGVSALVFPPTKRREAAWTYVLLGRDFTARGDLPGASRAYWAALTLLRTTFASRGDREQISRGAFRGLQEVATRRGKPQWAELMSLCASFSDVYLSSGQAASDESAFAMQVNRIRSAEVTLETTQNAVNAAKSAAEAPTLSETVASLSRQVKIEQAKQKGDYVQALSLIAEQVRDDSIARARTAPAVAAAQARAAQVGAEVAQASAPLASLARKLQDAVASEGMEIEAGSSFVGEEATQYLSSADAPARYLAVIRKFAAGKPSLLTALDGFTAGGNRDDGILAVALELRRVESAAYRAEWGAAAIR